MSRLNELYRWMAMVASHFSHLSKAQAAGLALWSFGLIIARSCTLNAVTGVLGPLLGQSFNTVRERLRDTYREAQAKAGQHRAELDLNECWAPWLKWVLEGWNGRQVALALDATTLGQRFVVLAISVLYRGCAVPVAWKILPATAKHPWHGEWEALLLHFKTVVPSGWKVMVLTDRGLYAKWLYEAICAMGWHPLMRINAQGMFRRQGWHRWQPMAKLVPAVGQRFASEGTAFRSKDARLECTLLGYWGDGHQEAWLVLTDLPPNAADVCWYGWRAWIEQGFKHLKGGGLAVAVDAHGRAGARRTHVAGAGAGNVVVGVGWRRSRSSLAGVDLTASAWLDPATGAWLAHDGRVSPWLEFDHRGVAQA